MRHFYVKTALERGWTVERVADLTKIDRWFIENIREILSTAGRVARYKGRLAGMPDDLLREAKRAGFSDVQIGFLTGAGELAVADLDHHRLPRRGRLRANQDKNCEHRERSSQQCV